MESVHPLEESLVQMSESEAKVIINWLIEEKLTWKDVSIRATENFSFSQDVVGDHLFCGLRISYQAMKILGRYDLLPPAL